MAKGCARRRWTGKPLQIAVGKPPVPPPDPAIPPKSQRQLYNEQKYRDAVVLGDPNLMQLHKSWIDRDEAERTREYNLRLEKWRSERALYNQRVLAWENYIRNVPSR
jgi:hypothetical protein